MKYIIKWDGGYGFSYDVVEAEDEDEALDLAYDYWKEEVESNADYGIVGEWTEELAEEHGV